MDGAGAFGDAAGTVGQRDAARLGAAVWRSEIPAHQPAYLPLRPGAVLGGGEIAAERNRRVSPASIGLSEHLEPERTAIQLDVHGRRVFPGRAPDRRGTVAAGGGGLGGGAGGRGARGGGSGGGGGGREAADAG